MIIALTGTHRTGKSTLAQRLHQVKDIRIELTEVKAFKPSEDSDNLSFIQNQLNILDYLCDTVSRAKYSSGIVLLDRTPIDAIGYLMAGLKVRDIELPEFMLKAYIEKAIKSTATIDRIFHVPIIDIDAVAEGSFTPNSELQIEVDSFIRTYLINQGLAHKVAFIPDIVSNVWERVAFIDKHIAKYAPVDYLESFKDHITTAEECMPIPTLLSKAVDAKYYVKP